MDNTKRRWEDWEKQLYTSSGLAGGGQLEIRMTISGEQPDPDILRVARRVRPYNLESWYTEWTTVADENAELAEEFERQGLAITAHEYYRRATDFYRRPLVGAARRRVEGDVGEGVAPGPTAFRAGADPLRRTRPRGAVLSRAWPRRAAGARRLQLRWRGRRDDPGQRR